ncbi:FAD/NAD(P)-binding protein [Cryptosporangium aurantiacum]|uniref:FAD-NAD(P)-binding n=1 Tax=Cryptosporangium aurantiacum TaxID=134849 RepID=A0A1M7JHZ0_9ACTN|nr:FAD/NAD(P)-binding protein [Cryptosporangium aurantiacum]SHM52690.1 FAD-NAD(P)-binding [Cryptosporangium aurantiacum]
MASTPVRVVLVGAGPRGTGLLERLTAHASALLSDRPLDLHVVDPFPFGPGRIWQPERAGVDRLDSVDDTAILPGEPSARAWAAAHARWGGAPAGEPLGRQAFGHYLTWAFWHTVRTAPAGVTIRTHLGSAVDVVGEPDGPQHVVLDTGAELTADVVVLAQGRAGTRPTAEQWKLADFADWRGLRYERPRDGDTLSFDGVPAGVDVLIRDAGPVTGDLVALLTVARGGRYVGDTYRPTGAEPRIHLRSPARPDLAPVRRPAAAAAWEKRRAALVDAGVVVPHPASDVVVPDATRNAFVLGTGAAAVAARTLIEPDTAWGPLRSSDDPLLRALAERGELAGWSGSGALLDRHGVAHPRRFAYGPLVGGADTLTGTALATENDVAARHVLAVLTGVAVLAGVAT